MSGTLEWALWTGVWLATAAPVARDAGEAAPGALRRHESVVIVASLLDPRLDRRDQAVFEKTLFSRDDQLLDTLAAGINAGQHEEVDIQELHDLG